MQLLLQDERPRGPRGRPSPRSGEPRLRDSTGGRGGQPLGGQPALLGGSVWVAGTEVDPEGQEEESGMVTWKEWV